MKPGLIIALAIIGQEILFNMHGLWPSNMVSNTVQGDMQTVVYDLSQASPWRIQRTCEQLGYVSLMVALLLTVPAAYRPYCWAGVAWYTFQAMQSAFTGNLQAVEWWTDMIVMASLLAGAFFWPKLRIVWSRWR